MNDNVKESLMKVREAETLINTRFATDKPEKLVNLEFQKKFLKAKSKYNYSKSMRGNADIIRDAAMMLRAYKALEQELVREGIMPLPTETWMVQHKATTTNVIICKDEAQKLNALAQYKDDYIIFSAEELINMLDKKSFDFKKLLTEQGMMPRISSYVKQEKEM